MDIDWFLKIDFQSGFLKIGYSAMPFSSCDENRLELSNQAELMFKQARELAKTDDHAGALEAYLFAFDNGKAVYGWGGVRLSYIPGEIALLGEKYPPAKLALQFRRDAREQMLVDGETDFDVLSEWLCLNRYLNEKDRELELLKDLEAKGILDDSVKERIVESNFERLLEEQRYEVLAEYLDEFGHKFMFQIFHYDNEVLFPDRRERKIAGESMSDFWKSHIAIEGAKVYELALGVKKDLQADEIAKRVLLVNSAVETYAMLLVAASRAGRKNKARELLKMAKVNLAKEDYEKLRNG